MSDDDRYRVAKALTDTLNAEGVDTLTLAMNALALVTVNVMLNSCSAASAEATMTLFAEQIRKGWADASHQMMPDRREMN